MTNHPCKRCGTETNGIVRADGICFTCADEVEDRPIREVDEGDPEREAQRSADEAHNRSVMPEDYDTEDYDTEHGTITPTAVQYHRNGVSGEPFYAVTFDWKVGDDTQRMLAVVFPPDPATPGAGPDWGLYERGEWDNPRIAVFDTDLLPDITFGANSWRGDNFARALYAAIRDYEAERSAPPAKPEPEFHAGDLIHDADMGLGIVEGIDTEFFEGEELDAASGEYVYRVRGIAGEADEEFFLAREGLMQRVRRSDFERSQ